MCSLTRKFCGEDGILFTSEQQAVDCVNSGWFRPLFVSITVFSVMLVFLFITIVIPIQYEAKIGIVLLAGCISGIIAWRRANSVPLSEWKADKEKIMMVVNDMKNDKSYAQQSDDSYFKLAADKVLQEERTKRAECRLRVNRRSTTRNGYTLIF